MRKSLIALAGAAAFSSTACIGKPLRVETGNPMRTAEPNYIEAEIVKHAKITAIKAATLEVTIEHQTGEKTTVRAGSEVRNFDQLKVGDIVTLKQSRAVTIELKKRADGIAHRIETFEGERAAVGELPGIAARRTMHIVGNISSIDKEKSEVAVKGPHQTRDIKVLDNELLGSLKIGDQVEAKVTESEALSIHPSKTQ